MAPSLEQSYKLPKHVHYVDVQAVRLIITTVIKPQM